MNDHSIRDPLPDDTEDLDDDSIPASLKLDWNEIFAACEPGHPGGRVVYDSGNYATEEEADAALDAFFQRIMDAPYE